MAVWGWRQDEGLLRFALALGLPIIAAVLWGTFAVPGDPSRSGQAPVPIPGALRLGLEAAILGFGIWAIYQVGAVWLSWLLGLATLVHYALSYDRLWWLIKR